MNIIQILECGQGVYEKTSGVKKNISYIVTEIAQGGELFDFIAITGKFSEPVARHFFKEYLAGLDHCHRAGLSHRDLKPENLMLDHMFNVKLVDFGFAAPVEGKDGSGWLTTPLGTPNFMAPEIHLRKPYQGRSVDIFASAIILFIMVAQHPPFTSAEPTDAFYKCLAANRADIFWKTHVSRKKADEKDCFMSESLKDLIVSMLQLDPAHRPTMSEIMAHPWMRGDTPSKEEVIAELMHRKT